MSRKIPKSAKNSGSKRPQSNKAFKENVPIPKKPVPIEKSPVKLTISILVSNRIDTVRKCLNSVKPLLDALPSELIVVDTVGPEHSDGSLAVAREYTDKIVRFHWCDDFSAARNAGLKLAKCEWFLYLDDDEWFDDVSAIIDFLKADDSKYNICLYRVRNYHDYGSKHYLEAIALRMFRLNREICFKYRIHEDLVGLTPPITTLDVFIHHYGYVYNSREDFEKHSLRNIQPLEEMLREHPDNLRAVMHLVKEYISRREYQKAEDLCRKALEENASPHLNQYCSQISCLFIAVLIIKKKWNDVLVQSQRLLQRPDIFDLAKCNICFQLNGCSDAIFNSQNLLSNVDTYFRLLDALDADPDKLSFQQVSTISVCQTEDSRASILESGLKRATYLGDEEHSWAYIKRIAKGPGEHHLILEKCMQLMVQFAADTKSFDRLYSLIEPNLSKDSSLSSFLSSIQSCLEPLIEYERPVELTDFLSGLPMDKPYILLTKMRAAEKLHDSKGLAELFNHFIGQEDAALVQEFIQIAYRNGLDLSGCAGKFNISQWNSGMRLLVDSYSLNQARDILKYLGSYFPNDSPELLALEAAFELKTLKENKVQSSMAESKDLHRYVELLYAYHLALNNAENFTEERSRYLSEEAQAAFYLKQSVKCGINGDHASQVRILKKVLHLQNDLVDFVDIFMKNLQNQIEQGKNGSKVQVKAEFQALADRLKSVVSEFILKGDFQNARNVLDQLNQLLPGDPDIPKLFMLLKQ